MKRRGYPYVNKLVEHKRIEFCVTRNDTTVIQFKHAYTYDEASGFVKVFTDCVRGDVTFFLRPAADAEVAVASAAADAPTAINDDDVADTPPPAVDSARLLMKFYHLLRLATRDTEDVLPAPSVALEKLERGGQFGTVFCIDFKGCRAAAKVCQDKDLRQFGERAAVTAHFLLRTMCCDCSTWPLSGRTVVQ